MGSLTDYIFYAEACKGYVVKVMAEILAAKLVKSNFNLTNEGITIQEADQKETIMYNITMLRENFRTYKCAREMSVKINLKYLQKIIRTTKKKDAVIMLIAKATPDKMVFRVRQDTNDSKKIAEVDNNTVSIQHETIPDPYTTPDGGYMYPVVIPSPSFQKIKKLTSIGKILIVKMQRSNYLGFFTDGGTVVQMDKQFGELVKEYDDENPKKGTVGAPYPDLYEGEFDTDVFSSLIKLSGLSAQMQFYAPTVQGLPLMMKMNTTLGSVEIYVKDLKQIQLEVAAREDEAMELIDEKAKKRAKKKGGS
jgi:hypothetical protein